MRKWLFLISTLLFSISSVWAKSQPGNRPDLAPSKLSRIIFFSSSLEEKTIKGLYPILREGKKMIGVTSWSSYLNTAGDIATALSAVVAACSLIAVFILYKLKKRDEYVSNFKNSLGLVRVNTQKASSLIRDELVHECAERMGSSQEFQIQIRDFYDSVLQKSGMEGKEVEEWLKERFCVPRGLPMNTQTKSDIIVLINQIDRALATYYVDYPAMIVTVNIARNRIVRAVDTVEEAIKNNHFWRGGLLAWYEQRDTILSGEDLAIKARDVVAGFVQAWLAQEVEFISILADYVDSMILAYLRLPSRKLVRLSHTEKKSVSHRVLRDILGGKMPDDVYAFFQKYLADVVPKEDIIRISERLDELRERFEKDTSEGVPLLEKDWIEGGEDTQSDAPKEYTI